MPQDWPGGTPRRPKQPRQPKKSSGGGAGGTTVGMAIVCFLCLPAGVVLGVAAFLLHGYGVI